MFERVAAITDHHPVTAVLLDWQFQKENRENG
jgi:hypothetical protein